LAFGLAAALGTGVVAVSTRRMSETHFSVVLVNYAAFSLLSLIAILTLQSMITGTSPSVFHYSPEIVGQMILCSVPAAFAQIF